MTECRPHTCSRGIAVVTTIALSVVQDLLLSSVGSAAVFPVKLEVKLCNRHKSEASGYLMEKPD